MKPCQTARLYSGNASAEDSVERGFERRADCQAGDDADDETCQHEELGGKAHQERRFMRRARQIWSAAGRRTRRV